MKRSRGVFLSSILLLLVGITLCSPAFAVTDVSGDITTDTVWGPPQDTVYHVVGTVRVINNATLTILPGVLVKFNDDCALQIGNGSDPGALQADGVTFTSSQPDGRWYGIYFSGDGDNTDNTMSSSIVNSTVENAGAWNPDIYWEDQDTGQNICCENTADKITIQKTAVQNSIDHGIYLRNSSPTITGSTISDNSGYAVFADSGDSNPQITQNTITNNTNLIRTGVMSVISGNTISGTTNPGIELYGGTITQDRTWYADQSLTYIVLGSISVYVPSIVLPPPTLTIQPGVTVKFNDGCGLEIGQYGFPGALQADGVTFTSNQTPGQWHGIYFRGNRENTKPSVIANSVVENGGASNSANVRCVNTGTGKITIQNTAVQDSSADGIWCTSSSPTISGCTIRANAQNGINLTSSSPLISGSKRIEGNSGYAVYAEGGDCNPRITQNTITSDTSLIRTGVMSVISGNTISGTNPGIEFWGGEITEDTTWYADQGAYIVLGSIYVYGAASPTLTIQPGVTVKFNDYCGLSILGGDPTLDQGALRADGVTFTSNQTPGQWNGIWFEGLGEEWTKPSVIANSVVEKAGADYNFNANVCCEWTGTGKITIQNTTVRNSSVHGIRCDSSSPTISCCTITGNAQNGIDLSDDSSPVISYSALGSEASPNGVSGIYCSNSSPTVKGCRVQHNSSYGIGTEKSSNPIVHGCAIADNCSSYDFVCTSTPSTLQVNAQGNWWGTSTQSEISQHIYDRDDNPNCAKVDFSGYLGHEPKWLLYTGILVSDVTMLGATVKWDTIDLDSGNPAASTSQVEYAPTADWGNCNKHVFFPHPEDPNLVTSHTVVLTGLSPDTEYTFQLWSGNDGENYARLASDTATFRTGSGALSVEWIFPLGSQWVPQFFDFPQSSPALFDIDKDGYTETLDAPHYTLPPLYCITHQGNPEWQAPTTEDFDGGCASQGPTRSSPAVADLDFDGYAEVTFGSASGHYLWVHDHMGNPVWNWRPADPGINYVFYGSPAVADLVHDVDNGLEIVIGSNGTGKVYCFDGDPTDGVDEGQPDGLGGTRLKPKIEAVTNDVDDQKDAKVQGGVVVWADHKNGNWDIYARRLISDDGNAYPVCQNGSDQVEPAIYANRVVWTDYRNDTGDGSNTDIYLGEQVEGGGIAEYPICTAPGVQNQPAIFADTIVWVDNRNGNFDIYGYDLSLDSDHNGIPNYRDEGRPDPDPAEFVICAAPGDQLHPAIYKRTVVWEDHRNGQADIYARQLDSPSEIPICVKAGSQEKPAIFCGSKVVWQDNRNGNYDIYYRLISDPQERVICQAQGDQTDVSIYGNDIVWFDHSLNDVVSYNLRTGTTTPLGLDLKSSRADHKPCVWGKYLVWTDSEGADSDLNVYSRDAQYDILWSFNAGAPISSSPAIEDVNSDGKLEVVIGCDDGCVYCLPGDPPDPNNVTYLWRYQTGGKVWSSPAVADMNRDGIVEVVFGSFDGRVYCVNGASGTLLWTYQTQGPVCSSPVLADINHDGAFEVIVGSDDGTVYCLSAGGIPIWSYKTNGRVRSSPSILDRDGDKQLETMIGSDDGVMYLLNSSGVMIGEVHTGVPISSSPSIADIDNDSRLEAVFTVNYQYSIPSSYKVWCVELDGACPQGDKQWTMFRHDPQRTGKYDRAPDLTLPESITINEGEFLEFTVSATDLDNDLMTFTRPSPFSCPPDLPTGAAFNVLTDGPGQIVGKFTWTPSWTQAGSYTVPFAVSDGVSTSARTVSITVRNVLVFGTIYEDPGGPEPSPLGGATVSVSDIPALGSTTWGTAITDSQGKFHVVADGVPDFTYFIRATKEGYTTVLGAGTLKNSQALPFSVTLSPK